ncbi:hypothetical protein BH11MYX4_BH11MYX4_20710 [soil metagenome]
MRHVAAMGVLLALMCSRVLSFAGSLPSAKGFESRLYAPCCYGGTLDIHESELARDLRKEIETRIASGEPVDSIQADFVSRYGDKVLAARSDAPVQVAGIALLGLSALMAAGLAVLLRRWTRKGPATAPEVSPGPAVRDELDARLDAELAELEA